MKKAFTLIELLVVVGIIGVISGVLVVSFMGTPEAAKATLCLTNMSNLAKAVQTYVGNSELGYYPLAGSMERMSMSLSRGSGNNRTTYTEERGWISWDSKCKGYPSTSHRSCDLASAYNTDEETRYYCLTNGSLWAALDHNPTCYRCPSHKMAVKSSVEPNWSYVMNAWFGWDTSEGSRATALGGYPAGRERSSISRADKLLLFAELQWMNYTGDTPDTSESAGTQNDCTLQYRNCCKGFSQGETIGFNHKSGKDIVAHVVYADGHVDKIRWRADQDMQELTEWICTGRDVAFNPKTGKYEEMK